MSSSLLTLGLPVQKQGVALASHDDATIEHGEGGYSLAKAVATVSLAPAQAVSLHDRGQIKEGLRADLVQVKNVKDQFLVSQVWVREIGYINDRTVDLSNLRVKLCRLGQGWIARTA